MANKSELVQITINIRKKFYEKLEAIAAIEGKSIDAVITRFINQSTKKDRKGCPYSHVPNKKTAKILSESKNGKGLVRAKDAQDLFKKLGISVKNTAEL